MDEFDYRRRLLDEARLKSASQSRNKIVGLLLTFFFPFFGFLYSGNYGWSVVALFVDVVNVILIFIFGVGLLTGFLWRLLAMVIASGGIDKHRIRSLNAVGTGWERSAEPASVGPQHRSLYSPSVADTLDALVSSAGSRVLMITVVVLLGVSSAAIVFAMSRNGQATKAAVDKVRSPPAQSGSADAALSPSPATPVRPGTCDDISAAQRLRPSVVRIQAGSSIGSGFVIDPGGFVLTNDHVVGASRVVSVTMAGGRAESATVVQTWPDKDLALVRISSGLPPVTWGDDQGLQPGQRLLALGYALDLPGEPTVTTGAYSARRSIDGESYVQTDTPTNPGNSGGPLFNQCGEVVGVVTLKLRNTEGLNFAIAASEARGLTASASSRTAPIVAARASPVPTLVRPSSAPAQPSSQYPPTPNLSLAESPSQGGDVAIKITSVEPGVVPIRGGTFEFRLTVNNKGAKGGAGGISVSSPNATSLTAELDSCDIPASVDLFPPGSSVITFGGGTRSTIGRMVTTDRLAEASFTRDWPAGGQCSFSVRAGVPGSGDLTLLLRTAVTAADGHFRTWPYGSDMKKDQQGFPAIAWSVLALDPTRGSSSSATDSANNSGCVRSLDGDWTFTDSIRFGPDSGKSYTFRVHLSRQGSSVLGDGDLTFSGRIDGCRLTATFGQVGGDGLFDWTFTSDGTHFSGTFDATSFRNGGDSRGQRQ